MYEFFFEILQKKIVFLKFFFFLCVLKKYTIGRFVFRYHQTLSAG